MAIPPLPRGGRSLVVAIDDAPGETRWALLDADAGLIEIVFQRAFDAEPGACYAGRVGAAVPGHPAVFVDLGQGDPGFLAAEDAPGGLPPQGSLIAVQVVRAAVEGKGPKLTAALTLAGRFVVWTPHTPGIGLSPKSGPPAARKALRARLETLLAPGDGVIARTGCADADPAALRQEITALRARAAGIARALREATAPSLLLAAPSPLAAWLGEPGGATATIHATSGVRLGALRASLAMDVPEWHGTLAPLGTAPQTLFDRLGIEEGLEEALAPVVPIPGGGLLRFGETAALTAIDIDARGTAPIETGLRAVGTLARHLRLRGLAGQILIDFPRERSGPDPEILAALRDALALDPLGPRVLGPTRGGLVEVHRPRRRAPLSDLLLAPLGPRQETTQTAVLRLLRRLRTGPPGARVVVRAAPRGHALLTGSLARALGEAVQQGGLRLDLRLVPEADGIDIAFPDGSS